MLFTFKPVDRKESYDDYLPRGVHEIGFGREMSPRHEHVTRMLHILIGQVSRAYKDGHRFPRGQAPFVTIAAIILTFTLSLGRLTMSQAPSVPDK